MLTGRSSAARGRRRSAPTSIRLAIRHALGDIFMLAADFVDEQRFRLAGTRLCALFGRELKGESFSTSWSDSSRNELAEMLTELDTETCGLCRRRHRPQRTERLPSISNCCFCRSRITATRAFARSACWRRSTGLTGSATSRSPNLHSAPSAISARIPARPPLRAVTSGKTGGQLRRGFMVYQGGLMEPAK